MHRVIPFDADYRALSADELDAVSGGDRAATFTAIALAESGGNMQPSTQPTFRTMPLWGCRIMSRF